MVVSTRIFFSWVYERNPFADSLSAFAWAPAAICCVAGVVAIARSRQALWAALAGLPFIGVAHVTDHMFWARNCSTFYVEVAQSPWVFLGWTLGVLTIGWALARRWVAERFDLGAALWSLAIATPVSGFCVFAAWAGMLYMGSCDGRYHADLHLFLHWLYW